VPGSFPSPPVGEGQGAFPSLLVGEGQGGGKCFACGRLPPYPSPPPPGGSKKTYSGAGTTSLAKIERGTRVSPCC